jgi:aminoglycoside phosphotransferase (APT) family kinase protein
MGAARVGVWTADHGTARSAPRAARSLTGAARGLGAAVARRRVPAACSPLGRRSAEASEAVTPVTVAPHIDADLVSRLIAAQFPQWADLDVRPVELSGWDNRTFRLGDELSVRLPSAQPYAAQVDKEQRWLPVLAPALPLPIPTPVARGAPGEGYPFAWSVLRWLDGQPASAEAIRDMPRFARELGAFVLALQRIDAGRGPAPGPHNFWRGGPLTTYAAETLDAIDTLGRRIPAQAARAVWEDAIRASWRGRPVWLHGDVAAGNLLIQDGRLAAVIDFGSSGVGDPACDLVIAWTLFSGPSRAAFRATLDVDDDGWARGRGWALWKALITLRGTVDGEPEADAARAVIREVLVDHAEDRRRRRSRATPPAPNPPK